MSKSRSKIEHDWPDMQTSNIAIGARIQELRRKKKLTQQELGEMLGITASSVGQYEIGITKPKLDTLIKISRELSINLEWLTTGEGDCEKIKAVDEDKNQFGREVIERIESENKYLRELVLELTQTNRKLSDTLGKPSGESNQRIGYNVLACTYKSISNNLGNTHFTLCG